MKLRSKSIPGSLALAACLLAAVACSRHERAMRSGSSGPAPAEGTAVVFGTTVDALTGEPLAGVTVQGPGGASTVSNDEGRFLLAGLPEGAQGELVARTADGREAKNLLRPLRNARLEVVLRLGRKP
jgi:hypothetical protein